MTPEQLKQRFPKAWAEYYTQYCERNSYLADINGKPIPLTEPYYHENDKIIAYLDSVGNKVDVTPYAQYFKVGVLLSNRFYYVKNAFGERAEYPDRPTATQAGIEKAFEIREKQLEEK